MVLVNRAITNKIAHLIRRMRLSGPHICGGDVFTNKAAREMKERVGQTLGRKEARGLMIPPSYARATLLSASTLRWG